jgi:hypothetical protein
MQYDPAQREGGGLGALSRLVAADGVDVWWYGVCRRLTFIFHHFLQLLFGPVIEAAFRVHSVDSNRSLRFSFHAPQFDKHWVRRNHSINLSKDSESYMYLMHLSFYAGSPSWCS